MDTQDCLDAIIELCSRKGIPKLFVSDNGTNLTRAEKELTGVFESIREIQGPLEKEFPNFKWKFMAAQTPHQNGAIERLVGIVKRSLYRMTELDPKSGK